jgi:hypothetical protein
MKGEGMLNTEMRLFVYAIQLSKALSDCQEMETSLESIADEVVNVTAIHPSPQELTEAIQLARIPR